MVGRVGGRRRRRRGATSYSTQNVPDGSRWTTRAGTSTGCATAGSRRLHEGKHKGTGVHAQATLHESRSHQGHLHTGNRAGVNATHLSTVKHANEGQRVADLP